MYKHCVSRYLWRCTCTADGLRANELADEGASACVCVWVFVWRREKETRVNLCKHSQRAVLTIVGYVQAAFAVDALHTQHARCPHHGQRVQLCRSSTSTYIQHGTGENPSFQLLSLAIVAPVNSVLVSALFNFNTIKCSPAHPKTKTLSWCGTNERSNDILHFCFAHCFFHKLLYRFVSSLLCLAPRSKSSFASSLSVISFLPHTLSAAPPFNYSIVLHFCCCCFVFCFFFVSVLMLFHYTFLFHFYAHCYYSIFTPP